jgi:hypothetical protein
VDDLWFTDLVQETASMDRGKPLQSSAVRSAFFVGQNSRGNWVARDQDGLRGGLFVSRDEAVRFAMLANIREPQDVIMVSGTLELDSQDRSETSSDELAPRRAA